MRKYAQVRPTFWTRGSGKKLRGKRDAQTLALYFVTGPTSTRTGLYYAPIVGILHDIGDMTEDQFRAALGEIGEIARYDFEEELVWLPNGCREQMGLKDGARIKPGDKSLRAVMAELEPFGEHPFALEFREKYLPITEAPSKGDTIPHTMGDTKGDVARGMRDSCMPPVPAPAPAPVPSGGCRGERDSVVEMGPGWRAAQNQIDNLVMGGALPEHAIEPSVVIFRGINMGKSDKSGAWDMSWARWAPKAYRTNPDDFRKPTDPTELEARAEAARRHHERRNAQVRAERARDLARASQGEPEHGTRPSGGVRELLGKIG